MTRNLQKKDLTERLSKAYEQNIAYIRERMFDLPTADQILTGIITEVSRELTPDEEMLLSKDLIEELNDDNIFFFLRCDRFLDFISKNFQPEVALLTVKEFFESEKGQIFVKNYLHKSEGWVGFTTRIPLSSRIFHIFVASDQPTV